MIHIACFSSLVSLFVFNAWKTSLCFVFLINIQHLFQTCMNDFVSPQELFFQQHSFQTDGNCCCHKKCHKMNQYELGDVFPVILYYNYICVMKRLIIHWRFCLLSVAVRKIKCEEITNQFLVCSYQSCRMATQVTSMVLLSILELSI